jgi:hypothetical protein
MKSLLSNLHWRSSAFPAVFCLLIATLYIGPFLMFPGFSVIDDGWTLHVVNGMRHSPMQEWSQYLVESDIGRLRPVYYLYFFLIYLVSGNHPFLFWLGQWAVLAGTLYVMYQLLFKATKHRFISLGGIAVPFLFPSMPENLYRLGTQEPRQFLLQISFLLWAMTLKENSLTLVKAAIGPVLLFLALGSKETSLILIPMFMAMYLLQLLQGHWRSPKFLGLVIVMVLIGVGFYAMIPTSKNYTLGYDLSLPGMVRTALLARMSEIHIFWLWGILGCLTAARLYFFSPSLEIKKIINTHFWQIIIFLAALGSFIIILPWNLQLERYYYNVTLFVLMFATIEAAAWWSLRKNIRKFSDFQKIALAAVIFFLGLGMTRIVFHQQIPPYSPMLSNTTGSMKVWFSSYQNNYAVAHYLMTHTRENESFYAAFPDYEVVYDMGQFASLFGDRKITVYHANPQLGKDRGFPYVFIEDPYAAYQADQGPKLLVDKAIEPKLSTLSTPIMVMKPRVSFYNELKDFWSSTQSP